MAYKLRTETERSVYKMREAIVEPVYCPALERSREPTEGRKSQFGPFWPHKITTDIAYVGNRGRQQIQSYEGGLDMDQLPVQDLALGPALGNSVSNPFYGSITSGTLSASTTTEAQLLLRYPQWTSMEPLRQAGGNSQYDGLQATIRKSLSSNLQFQASYAWSRNFARQGKRHMSSGINCANSLNRYLGQVWIQIDSDDIAINLP
jgi:hypothetical protein